jgi:tetratricopeptide (TPR) repeat protein
MMQESFSVTRSAVCSWAIGQEKKPVLRSLDAAGLPHVVFRLRTARRTTLTCSVARPAERREGEQKAARRSLVCKWLIPSAPWPGRANLNRAAGQRQSWRRGLSTVAGVVFLCASVANAQTEVRSIEQFNKLKSQLQRLAADRTPLKVEGRHSTMSDVGLLFQNCDVWFRPVRDQVFKNPTKWPRMIEVHGHMAQQRGKFVFVVQKMLRRPSDLRRLQIDELGIRGDAVEQRYQLAKWAAARAAFYDDKVLRQRAEALFRRGLTAEREKLADGDTGGLFALADKAAGFKLPASLQLEFRHEACQKIWSESPDEQDKDVHKLLETMLKLLPGCTKTLKSPQTKFEEKYWANPLSVYRDADETARLQLHRIFFRHVLLSTIVNEGTEKTKNGFQIADEIDKQVPERHDLAEEYRDRQLADELAHVAFSTRPEAERLAGRFRERKQPEKAQQALQLWLDAREKQLRPDGAAGLWQLAEEYLSVMSDRPKAVSLLVEAYELSPESKEIAERLTRLGYRLTNGKWLSTSEVGALPETPLARSMREGIVAVGMTSEQVRKTLGSPTGIMRVATSGQINDVWIYGERGKSRLAIQFIRPVRRSLADAHVVAVSQIPAR